MAAAFRATTQILEEPEAIVDKTAPAKWPKSDCHDSKADEYGASMATIGRQIGLGSSGGMQIICILMQFSESGAQAQHQQKVSSNRSVSRRRG